uniref:Uncharacterized protein n=1 Tax=Tetradesmus obliquus TaxID=3088 RepID=A0A383VIP2_TETOB|eukprot:jgi/Sobl393_1/18540/SZX64699.1
MIGLTACAAAQHAGARRLHSSNAQHLDSIGFEASSSSGSSDEADFAPELDLLPRLLQEQMAEDAAVAAAAAATAQRFSVTGELSTPGAYGSLDSPDAETAAGNDSITILPDDATATNDTADSTVPDSTVAGSTADAKPGLEAATRGDSAQSVAGSGGPVDSQSREGKVAEQLNGGQTAGIVLGVFVAAGVVALGVFAYQRHKKNNQEDYISRYRRYEGGIEMQ